MSDLRDTERTRALKKQRRDEGFDDEEKQEEEEAKTEEPANEDAAPAPGPVEHPNADDSDEQEFML